MFETNRFGAVSSLRTPFGFQLPGSSFPSDGIPACCGRADAKGWPAHEPVLVVRAQRGDVRAFEQLHLLYRDRIYGLCIRLVRNTAVAEGCTQQAFINAWTSLPGF